MRAIVHDRYGPPSAVLHLREIDAPVAADDGVLIRVHAAGITKGDWLITVGQPYVARPMYGARTPKHRVAGQEVAGRVEAVGPRVTQFQVGDEVFGWCNGAFAEYAAVDSGQLAPKPGNATMAQAAAVPMSGFTALQAVRDRGEVRPGHRVLVIGASGGVGSFAVQIAKAFGAEVTGVASTRNVDLVRSLGADHVIDYTREDIVPSERRCDVIIDIAGNRPVSTLRRALTPNGTLVIVGGTGGPATMGYGRTISATITSPFVGQRLRSLISRPNRRDLDVLKDLIESDQVIPAVDQTYSLEEVPDAVDQVGSGHSRGKRAVIV